MPTQATDPAEYTLYKDRQAAGAAQVGIPPQALCYAVVVSVLPARRPPKSTDRRRCD